MAQRPATAAGCCAALAPQGDACDLYQLTITCTWGCKRRPRPSRQRHSSHVLCCCNPVAGTCWLSLGLPWLAAHKRRPCNGGGWFFIQITTCGMNGRNAGPSMMMK